jgi:hypothetical protein
LIDEGKRTGQLTRAASWPGEPWKAEQVGVWEYPEDQLSGQESLSAQHQQTLLRLTDMWKTPVTAEKVKIEDQEVLKPKASNLYLFARLDHAQGLLEDATMRYTRVRVQLREVSSRGELQQIRTERLAYAYTTADEDALYWTAVCKVDQGSKSDLKIATDKLQQYVKAFASKGRWVDASHALQAQLAADAGDYATAIAEIQLVAADHPQHQGYEFLKRKWEHAATAKK